MRSLPYGLSLFISLAALPAPARAEEPAPPAPVVAAPVTPSAASQSVEQRLEDLEQQHRILVRQLELEREKAVEEAKKLPIVSLGPAGFLVRTPNGAFALKLRGLVQAD